MKLMYSVVIPAPRTQVLASLFNYALTNSEDRRFEAAVSDTEPVVCLSVCRNTTSPFWHYQAGAVAPSACGDALRTCDTAARNRMRMKRLHVDGQTVGLRIISPALSLFRTEC